MLSEISKKATYHGKARNIEFWKGVFVSGWQIATNQHPEIISGLEGELINIRESTATLSVKKNIRNNGLHRSILCHELNSS